MVDLFMGCNAQNAHIAHINVVYHTIGNTSMHRKQLLTAPIWITAENLSHKMVYFAKNFGKYWIGLIFFTLAPNGFFYLIWINDVISFAKNYLLLFQKKHETNSVRLLFFESCSYNLRDKIVCSPKEQRQQHRRCRRNSEHVQNLIDIY